MAENCTLRDFYDDDNDDGDGWLVLWLPFGDQMNDKSSPFNGSFLWNVEPRCTI